MHIHFIGIGGIGVSALAKYYLEKGHQVTGSDLVSSEITDALKKQGAKISIGPHRKECLTWSVKQSDLVIYSPAIPPDNPELKMTKKLGIKCQSYPKALGELTKRHFTIAVSGTHGKSTTASMIGLILIKAGLDPTVIVGTKLKEFAPHQKNGGGSNCRVGKSPEGKPSVSYGARKYLVIEADEHLASFLNYWPKIIVLTSIEADHLDYYKNLKNILKAFRKYISHLPKDGILVANGDDKNIKKIIQSKKAKSSLLRSKRLSVEKIKTYSLKQRESEKLRKILKVPGEHNIYNASLALATARVLKIPDKVSFKALSDYKGSWRRFEIKHVNLRKFEHKSTRITIVSDYGHHPTEIRVTLKAAREKYPKKEIWCVYQPHQYQRTYYLFKDFVKVFREAPVDKLIITDIYDVAGREETKIKKRVSSEKLVQAINNGRNRSNWSNRSDRIERTASAIYLPKEKIIDYLKENLKGGEVVIIMGAGDIYKLAVHLTGK